MTPEELAKIEACNKQARTYMNGAVAAGVHPYIQGDDVRVVLDTVDALLAEVRRLTATPKVEREPACKIAVWGPVRGSWGVAALRVNKRIKAHYNGRDRAWWAYTDGVAHARRVYSEAEARAHIETWAKAKGWEVRDGE